MAERSSELEKLNDFGTEDQQPDDRAAERVAEQIGVTGEVGTATAYSTATLADSSNVDDTDADEVRTMTARNRSSEANLATTSGATETYATDDDDDETALATITDDDAAATSNTSPANAVVDATAPPEEIKASIESTRTEMSETINAIQEKLSIANITSQVKEEVTGQISGAYESVKHALFGATFGKAGGFFEKMSKSTNQIVEDYGPAISDAGTTVVRTAKRNPIPFALIGLGVGMILLGGSRKRVVKTKSYRYTPDYEDTELDYDYSDRAQTAPRNYTGTSAKNRGSQKSTAARVYNRVGDTASSAYSGVAGAASSAVSGVSDAATSAYSGVASAAGSAGSAVSGVAGSAYNQVGNLGTGVKQVASRVGDTYEQQLNENPYTVGAVAFALGAVVGLAIPATAAENSLLGEYRENLLQKAQEAAGGVIDKVQQVAGEATKTLQEEAKAQGLSS